jgi:signal transduction histidine kinase
MGLDASTEALNLRRRYVEGLTTRVIGSLCFASAMILATALPTGVSWAMVAPAVWILLGNALINVVYWYDGKRVGFLPSHFYGHWMMDLVVNTAIIYFLGGIDLPLGQFAYFTIIPTAAILLSQRAAFHLAFGATVAYALLALAEGAGWLPPRVGIWGHHFGSDTRLFIVGFSAVFFFVFAYLAGTLAELVRAANEELASTKAVVEDQNRLLEQRVRERTRDLEARTVQLQDQKAELEELVHIVTHDLQNVAVASSETTRLLVEHDGPQFSARGQRYAERLLRDCRLMATMLRNLLEAVTQSEVADRRELVDVSSVVREAVARAQGVIETKGIDIDVGDLPPVRAEQQKLYHVFENLLSNAFKYVGDKSHPHVDVRGIQRDDHVEYAISDNGIGIEESQMNRIFQLYHRSPEQTVAGVVQQGHGIGLAVVKRIVQRYGGRISVESVHGQGSTFRIVLPNEVPHVAKAKELRMQA